MGKTLKQDITRSFTEKELKTLNETLLRRSDCEMDIFKLHGFLCALVCAPRIIPMSKWAPFVYGDEPFESIGELQDLLDNIMCMNNQIANTLLTAKSFNPLLSFDEASYDPKKLSKEQKLNLPLWCGGFVMGMLLDLDTWDRRGGEDMATATLPILTLASDTNKAHAEFKKIFLSSPSPVKIEEFKKNVAYTLPQLISWIYHYWREYPVESKGLQRNNKTGRNEPCPCGSGKKFKKCCGDNSRIIN